MFAVGRRHSPAAQEGPLIEEWGDEDTVRERFGHLANSIEMERRTLTWAGDSPEAFVEAMERDAPPQAAAKATMPPDAYAAFHADMVQVAREWAGGDGAFSVAAEYLVTVARRRG
jgi:hypothetical protein